MIFQRTKRNRRFGQSRILDVKLSSNQVRSARMRFLGLALSVACVALFILFTCWRGGEWLLNRFIYENDAFAVRQIDVRTDGVLAANYLRTCAGVKVGANLFAVDLVRVRRNLEQVPWIRSVAVERILPDTLKLRVSERIPVAQFAVAQNPANRGPAWLTNQLDASGFVMPPMPAWARVGAPPAGEQFPVITGLVLPELRPGQPLEQPQVRAALRLIEEFDRSPMLGIVDIARIDVATPEVLQCTTGQGAEATFPLNEPAVPLNRWRLAWDYARSTGKFLAAIDLSISKNIPGRLVEAGTVNPPPPRRPSTSRTLKRHV